MHVTAPVRPEPTAAHVAGRAAVALSNVRRTYGEVVALDTLDLEVEPGEVVALLGPNGAGKSTLFELLLGLVSPTRGSVRVFGRSPGVRTRRRIGAMLQHAGLPEHVTVVELVRLVARSYPRALAVDEVVAAVGLDDHRARTIGALSGGERQRLLLALATVGAPDLLLLDEPTAAMDLDGRRGFWDRTRDAVARGATLVFATHDLTEADAVADRIVLLHQGRVIADASPAELKRLVPGCVLTLTTDAPIATLAALDGVERVDPFEGMGPAASTARVAVTARDAESVVVPLVRAGHHLADLQVTEADLETACAHLTRLAADADPSQRRPAPSPTPPA